MSTYNVIEMAKTGGPDVLTPGTRIMRPLAPGEVLIKQRAIGVNFIDTYQRSGLYPVALPFIPGTEGVGIVEGIGPDVRGVAPGDRVATMAGSHYADYVFAPADRVVHLPEGVSDTEAAALYLKGLTAYALLFDVARVTRGMRVLVWAAAGGVGSVLVPWAAALGAEVIAITGSPAKAAIAAARGAHHTVLDTDDIIARVRDLTGGEGVDVSFDSVGASSVEASLGALRRRGHFVSFGNASGPVPPLSLLRLASAGSLTVTRPRVNDYVVTPAELQRAAGAVFAGLAEGTLRPMIGATLPLREATTAHRQLEARATTGATILLP